jgi:hypothetical protein
VSRASLSEAKEALLLTGPATLIPEQPLRVSISRRPFRLRKRSPWNVGRIPHILGDHGKGGLGDTDTRNLGWERRARARCAAFGFARSTLRCIFSKMLLIQGVRWEILTFLGVRSRTARRAKGPWRTPLVSLKTAHHTYAKGHRVHGRRVCLQSTSRRARTCCICTYQHTTGGGKTRS